MADRNGYIGRAPGDSSITIARKTYEPTGVQTDFTFTAGYNPGYCDVYLNGIRLINGNDYTASNGSTVGLTSEASSGDIVEIVAYKAFNLGVPVSDITGNLDVTGNISASSSITAGTFYGSASGLTGVGSTDYIITGTAATFNSQVKVLNLNVTGITSTTSFNVGSATTIDGGGINVTGIITATSFSGSGSGLTGVASTDNIITGTAATFRNTAVSAGVPNVNIVGLATVGIITAYGTAEITGILTTSADAYVGDALDIAKDIKVGAAATITGALSAGSVASSGAVSGTTGTFSGAVNVDATTDSTSATSGALIVDGGLGVAKNVYIGAGLSVAGTLTYEDVTSVDSVGLITAKSGVNVTGGQLTVGTGITMGIAGVATFSGTGDVHLLDNVRLNVGDGSDLAIYHSGSHSFIQDEGTGSLYIDSNQLYLRNADTDNVLLYTTSGGAVRINHNGTQKMETSSTGINPSADSTDDLGTNAIRWRNIYGDTLYGDGSNLTGISAGGISTSISTAAGIVSTLALADAQDHKVTVSGITTFTCNGGTEGETHTLRLVNSGVSTVGFSTYFLFPSGAAPSIPTTDGTVSLISFTVHRQGSVGIATQLLAGASLNFS